VSDPFVWKDGPPEEPGLYRVRPRRDVFLSGTGIVVPRVPVRVVSIAAGDERFDAGDIAGFVRSSCWQWSGPISIPDSSL
jgi:hypothetical protein